MPRQVKVAVVGSGLAGLTAAYLLTKPTSPDSEDQDVVFDVHLFEKADMLGMDSSSISVPIPGQPDKSWRIDVPMRSFQDGYYRQVIALYRHLGVAFTPSYYSYSFSLFTPSSSGESYSIDPKVIHNGAGSTAGLSLPSSLLPKSKDQAFPVHLATRLLGFAMIVLMTVQLAACYLRLLFFTLPFLRPRRWETMSFAEWVEDTTPRGTLYTWTGFDTTWKEYARIILVPSFSVICTAKAEDVLLHPAEEFLDYFWLTIGYPYYFVTNGVRDVVFSLSATVKNIHVSTTIAAITADPSSPDLVTVHASTGEYTGFHHVIFATQANRAVPLLESYHSSLPAEAIAKRKAVANQIACLKSLRYHNSIVTNHTDPSLMPSDPRDQRDLNLVSLDGNISLYPSLSEKTGSDCVSASFTMSTEIMRPPVGYPSNLPRIYQTTCPFVAPAGKHVLSVARLERGVLTVKSKETLKQLYKEEGRRWWQCAGQGTYKLGDLQGAGRLAKGSGNLGGAGIWICGSYAYAGIPLLEGCVVSARGVVEQGVWQCEGIDSKARGEPW